MPSSREGISLSLAWVEDVRYQWIEANEQIEHRLRLVSLVPKLGVLGYNDPQRCVSDASSPSQQITMCNSTQWQLTC